MRRMPTTGGGFRARHPLVRFVVLAASMVLLAACAPPPLVARPGSASLGDAVLAIYLSPQARHFPAKGKVVFVDPDGSTTAIETSGMDNGKLLWRGSGLFFSDTDNDYLLNDRLYSWPSPKTTYQDAALASSDGESIISVFNEGAGESGYTEQIVVSDGHSASQRYDVFGLNEVIGQCSEGLVGVAEVTGEELTKLAATRGVMKKSGTDRPMMLTRLYPRPDSVDETLISVQSSDSSANNVWGVVPCQGGVMTYLVSRGDTSRPELWVYRWNTRNGVADRHRLRTDDGVLEMVSDDFGSSVLSPKMTADGGLLWYGGDGVIRATDPKSGLTKVLWDSGLPDNNDGMTEVLFQGRWLFLLDVPNKDQNQPLTLHRRDALTGQGDALITIPGVNQQRRVDNVLRGIAVRPDLAA